MAQQTLKIAVLYWQGLVVTADIQYNDANNKITGVVVTNPTDRNLYVKASDSSGSLDLVFAPGSVETIKGIGNRVLVERLNEEGNPYIGLPEGTTIATEISEYR